jgi:hypothetical protein
VRDGSSAESVRGQEPNFSLGYQTGLKAARVSAETGKKRRVENVPRDLQVTQR